MSEGQKGGEFFTPISLVKLIVEMIEPYRGLPTIDTVNFLYIQISTTPSVRQLVPATICKTWPCHR